MEMAETSFLPTTPLHLTRAATARQPRQFYSADQKRSLEEAFQSSLDGKVDNERAHELAIELEALPGRPVEAKDVSVWFNNERRKRRRLNFAAPAHDN